MDSLVLIDSIVQQTTVLIAQLSTAMGVRAPLSHVADQVFLDLAREIEAQGVSRKVVADMFGMALRAYQKKVQRLTDSASERHRTLWQAVYAFIEQSGQVQRDRIEQRFSGDPQEHVGAVLHDLVASGLVFTAGRGLAAQYRHVPLDDSRSFGEEALDELVCLRVYRGRGLTLAALCEQLPVPRADLESSLGRLVANARVAQQQSVAAGDAMPEIRYRMEQFTVPVGQQRGWEAAVFDHYSTVAAAIAHKLRLRPGAKAKDVVGGATLSFDVHPGHAFEAEVYGLLGKVRAELNELWCRVAAHNQAHPIADDDKIKVSFYFGQNVSDDELETEPDAPAQPAPRHATKVG